MTIIRGAVCAENSVESISQNALTLTEEILRRNRISSEDVKCVFFSATQDLDACYPATAVRRNLLPEASFMCFGEMRVDGSMPKVLRIAVFVDRDIIPKHCYLGKTAELRSDL